jgi:signal peptidase I
MQKKAEEPEKPRETTVEFLASLASVLVSGLFIITFIVQAFEIPSSSMENTLLIGDHVFVDRVAYAPPSRWMGPLLPYREIQHNDIVVFLSPMTPGLYVVKRIIGLPGDRIHLQDGVVYRNGERLDESKYVIRKVGDYIPFRDNFPSVSPPYNASTDWQLTFNQYLQGGELVVPNGSYFAMGDNRDESYDSRYWGFIPRQNVIGRPMFIYWSFETPRDQYEQRDIFDRVKNFAGVVLHFFDRTRWRRTLKAVR